MREIKFRAWDKKRKKMFPVYSLTFKRRDGLSIFADDYESSTKQIRKKNTSVFNDEEAILMQYTGLKDKNGKEIYEGDIVIQSDLLSSANYGALIIWHNAGFYLQEISFFTKSLGRKPSWGDTLNQNKMNHYQVVGNRYQNPELLK